MGKRLEEISVTITGERFRFGESEPFTVILDGVVTTEGDALPDTITLKGKTEGSGDDEEPKRHLSYRFYGGWTNYTNKRTGQVERQFLYNTFVRATPHTRAGIMTYLDKAPHIGRILAGRLFAKFGGDSVRILRELPEVAAAACPKLSVEAAYDASEWLQREKALEDCSIDLIELVEGRGFPKTMIKAAIKEWGNRAGDVIRRDPYKLQQFRGCGFKRADALYLDLGLPPARLRRQAMCAAYHVVSRSEGNTWEYFAVAEKGLRAAISGADVRFEAALELATRGGMLAAMRTNGVDGPIDWDGDTLWLSDARKARNEARLAKYVVEAMNDPTNWPLVGACKNLTVHQRAQLGVATESCLGILGGGPGCGKTFAAAQLIKLLGGIFGYNQIAAAAPTGKAAVRLTEAMNGYGIPLTARTIHSLLKVESNDGGWSFAFNRSNPLAYKVLIIDESSMIDTDLGACLFAARPRGCLVLVIGDVGQLPPVGHGAPLRDMIAAGVPYGELREIHRNEGGIVQACADIRDSKPFQCDGNLRLVPANTPSEQRDAMLETITEQSQLFGVDPVWGVQVLCAVNKKGDLARRDLNKLLQQNLNPNPMVAGSPFRLKDKVINSKNGWFPLVEAIQRTGGRVELVDNDENLVLNIDRKVYVANGEMGEVVRVEGKYFHVQLTAPRRLVIVPRGQMEAVDDDADVKGDEEGNVENESTGTGCDWELGYAISTHKSQGSEFPVVIVMVDEGGAAKRVCSKEWLYTSISRAKQCCVLIGKLEVARTFTRRTAIDKRKTFLKELLQQGMNRE